MEGLNYNFSYFYLIFEFKTNCGLLFLVTDQFIACGKSREKAYELASIIWLAVIDNLDDTEQTFYLLKRLALEGDVSRITHIRLLF